MLVAILTRLRALLQRGRVAREVDDELQFHVAMETESNLKLGMPPTEARRTALRDLGGIEQTKETIRGVRVLSIDGIWRDARYAISGTLKARHLPSRRLTAAKSIAKRKHHEIGERLRRIEALRLARHP